MLGNFYEDILLANLIIGLLFIILFQVHSVAWNCNGRYLASGSFDKTVSIFNLDKDRLVKSL